MLRLKLDGLLPYITPVGIVPIRRAERLEPVGCAVPQDVVSEGSPRTRECEGGLHVRDVFMLRFSCLYLHCGILHKKKKNPTARKIPRFSPCETTTYHFRRPVLLHLYLSVKSVYNWNLDLSPLFRLFYYLVLCGWFRRGSFARSFVLVIWWPADERVF